MSPAAHVLRGLVRAYQLTLSSVLGRQCRFLPTCSEYAMEALARHGAAKGGWLALRRFLRCHPFATAGYDPVPAGRAPVGTRAGTRPAPPDARPPSRSLS
jgi:putative membrane protein insertion efficiency factor